MKFGNCIVDGCTYGHDKRWADTARNPALNYFVARAKLVVKVRKERKAEIENRSTNHDHTRDTNLGAVVAPQLPAKTEISLEEKAIQSHLHASLLPVWKQGNTKYIFVTIMDNASNLRAIVDLRKIECANSIVLQNDAKMVINVFHPPGQRRFNCR